MENETTTAIYALETQETEVLQTERFFLPGLHLPQLDLGRNYIPWERMHVPEKR